ANMWSLNGILAGACCILRGQTQLISSVHSAFSQLLLEGDQCLWDGKQTINDVLEADQVIPTKEEINKRVLHSQLSKRGTLRVLQAGVVYIPLKGFLLRVQGTLGPLENNWGLKEGAVWIPVEEVEGGALTEKARLGEVLLVPGQGFTMYGLV
ncbi:putative signal peptide protein, partial [Puccinia sorghi]